MANTNYNFLCVIYIPTPNIPQMLSCFLSIHSFDSRFFMLLPSISKKPDVKKKKVKPCIISKSCSFTYYFLHVAEQPAHMKYFAVGLDEL